MTDVRLIPMVFSVPRLPMCSLAVLKMAEDVSPPGQSTRQPLHPFFAPNRGIPPISHEPPADKDCESIDSAALLPSLHTDGKSSEDALESAGGRQTKRRKIHTNENDGEVSKKKRGRPKKHTTESIASQPGALGKGSKDPEQGIPPSSEKPQVVEPSGLVIPNGGVDCQLHIRDGEAAAARETQSQTHQSLQPQGLPSSVPNTNTHLKPKKLLLFNPKTGTIGSPPKPKQSKVVGANADDDSRSPKNGKPTTRIVKMTYGWDSESRSRIGGIIDVILSQKPPTSATDPQELVGTTNQANLSPPEVVKAKPPKPAKTSTHPFFLGKKVDVPAENPKDTKVDLPPAPKRTKQFTSTPCSPKKPRAEAPTTSAMRMPQFGSKNPGLKFPGSKLPAWPWKDMIHVRGDEEASQDVESVAAVLSSRKSKGHSVKVSTFESVIDSITRDIEVPVLAEVVRNVNTDEFLPAPPELRVPRKHFESGSKLQARIVPELKTFQSLVPAKESRLGRGKPAVDGMDNGPHPPPQLARLFNSIRSGLSAFDMSQCETSNWTQKYAPTSAVEVLQPGKEAFLLRDWLQALMVQSVDTGSTEAEKSKSSKAKAADAGKKKRRKKLDGFIVSSGDEDYEMAELSDVEEGWTPNGVKGVVRKTVVRSGDLSKMRDGVKIANTLIISGPHGCGKTAAVYAVAKELNFEVFEINPGSRRSGKDIMEKIGDMTRNHLVQHHKSPNSHKSPNPPADQGEADINATDDELAKDLKSGKQATMNAFFKPKSVPAKPKDIAKAPAPVQPKEANTQAKKESSKNQRQSLILLEEVDILYAEDKQFWVTVMELIAQSKRPFIMTCNDESLVPLQSLRLHGIFRFGPPPRELAIDRLLLTAANEGHALTRQAVETLYESRKQDLRAATMDLQYWCQIGVGDRRGGFDWFYPRWPKGVDLDENNEVVRVVSEGTYHAGMSWLGRDTIVDPKASSRAIEEELLHQTWETWGLDIGRWQDSVGLSSWATSIAPVTATREGRLSVLESFDSLTEALSVADVCSCRSFAMFKEVC